MLEVPECPAFRTGLAFLVRWAVTLMLLRAGCSPACGSRAFTLAPLHPLLRQMKAETKADGGVLPLLENTSLPGKGWLQTVPLVLTTCLSFSICKVGIMILPCHLQGLS